MTRLERFKALMDRYQQVPDDFDEECEEDPRPYFDEGKELDEWCCVTINYSSSGGKYFFLPTFGSAEGAELRAIEFVLDDMFEEIPVEVHNLDTGESRHAAWDTLQFIPAP